MRAVLAAGLTGLLLLSACTGDDTDVEPTGAASTPTPSQTATASPSATSSVSDSPSATDEEPRDEPPGEGDAWRATLDGAQVVPGPGDGSGSGTFTGTLTPGEASAELCYELTVEDLASPVTAAHVHEGPAGAAGGVAVALDTPAEGSVSGCVTVEAGTAVGMLEDPTNYYVQVHSESHPDGAVRGQIEES